MKAFDYDLFVIGGGSGGVRAARVAGGMGKRVAIAEEDRYGGTCVIRGCVPKKLLVYASQFREAFEDAGGFGWTVPSPGFDWPTLIANKNAEIARLEAAYRNALTSNRVETFASRATLEGEHEIRIHAVDRVVSAERILIATGGLPSRLDTLPGHEHCITSAEAFDLQSLPEKIVIKGGGYIAVEFAGIFAGLGADTTLVYRGDHLLRGFDHDLGKDLAHAMEIKGIRVLLNRNISKVEAAGSKKQVTLDDGSALDADTVMLAVGRLPNTRDIGLEKAGVQTDRIGAVRVDEFSRSNVKHILAVGDVTNRVALTPVAIHEAVCLVETEFGGTATSPDHELIPTAVFSQPEIGTVGLGEEAACRRFARIDVYQERFTPMKHTLSGRDEQMMLKIIVDAGTDRVVGVHILGPDAGELIQAIGIAVKMGATKSDFDRTMAVHPTAAEELVTMYRPAYSIRDGVRL
jgi:glutathione reductase (NADPH)